MVDVGKTGDASIKSKYNQAISIGGEEFTGSVESDECQTPLKNLLLDESLQAAPYQQKPQHSTVFTLGISILQPFSMIMLKRKAEPAIKESEPIELYTRRSDRCGVYKAYGCNAGDKAKKLIDVNKQADEDRDSIVDINGNIRKPKGRTCLLHIHFLGCSLGVTIIAFCSYMKNTYKSLELRRLRFLNVTEENIMILPDSQLKRKAEPAIKAAEPSELYNGRSDKYGWHQAYWLLYVTEEDNMTLPGLQIQSPKSMSCSYVN
ncbi:unnamed protein product [Thlaspi arvense]|uniref:Uncharacterized protein n=1 Tax=Thlaspi arvense TaxID=13288 RepID=A0AAU9SF60_THLAR|nr:unnamed protein product [Thlaspi arvense]